MATDTSWLVVDVRLPVGDRTVALAPTSRRLGIVGPSGTGKSTLLRAIAGIERRVAGRIAFGGVLWQDTAGGAWVEPWLRRIGWVAQDARLFPHVSVADNIGWRGEPAPLEHARALGIEALLGRMPANLSGGERQRVALLRAVVARPSLLVLDEPLSALDRSLRERVTAWLREYCDAHDVPVVVVSHDERDLAALDAEIHAL